MRWSHTTWTSKRQGARRTMEATKADCPTPRKMRFTTRSSAKRSAAYRSRSVGFPLYTYKCACGSFHMTRQRQEITETPDAQVHGLGHALGMRDDAFMNVVIADVGNALDPDEGVLLRHPDVVDRWRQTLINTRKKAEAELAEIRKLRSPTAEDDEWRSLLVEYIDVIGARQRECAEIRSRQGNVRPIPSVTAAAAKAAYVESRPTSRHRTAGDRAIETLVNRHRSEFSEIFNTEARRIGLELKF